MNNFSSQRHLAAVKKNAKDRAGDDWREDVLAVDQEVVRVDVDHHKRPH